MVDKINSVPDTNFAGELGVNKKRIFNNSSQNSSTKINKTCLREERKKKQMQKRDVDGNI